MKRSRPRKGAGADIRDALENDFKEYRIKK
jgi:hypothetical protein